MRVETDVDLGVSKVLPGVVVGHIRGTRDVNVDSDEIAIFEPVVVFVMTVLRTLAWKLDLDNRHQERTGRVAQGQWVFLKQSRVGHSEVTYSSIPPIVSVRCGVSGENDCNTFPIVLMPGLQVTIMAEDVFSAYTG